MAEAASTLKILYVCVGNACRSPMAEAWTNYYGKGRAEAHSAGIFPYGRIIEETYDAMLEKMIRLDGQCSKGLMDVEFMQMDMVVRMGREVAFVPPEGFKGRVIDWNIPDPYGRGIETFRSVRDLIEQHVVRLLKELE